MIPCLSKEADLQVYLHYPYCATLCPYCDFFSTTSEEDPAYASTIIRELELWSEWVDGRVTTIYFGGGTPGRMSPALTARLLGTIDRLFGISASAEITLEANPEDITAQGLADFRSAGINRLSIGVQSLEDQELQWLGRRHDALTALRGVDSARQAGFDNLSLDLIFGLPNQLDSTLDKMLVRFFGLGAEHVSLYGLTIEDGTHFGTEFRAGRLEELDRSTWLRMYQMVADKAAAIGMHRYEISNFAKPGRSSRHNRSYWRDRTFIGVGPGAHGQRQLGHGGLERRCNPKSLRGWKQKVDQGSQELRFVQDDHDETLTPNQWLREASMLGVRDFDLGIDPEHWGNAFGLADAQLLATVQRLIEEKTLTNARPYRLTQGAVHRVDAVAGDLLNAESVSAFSST